MACTGELSTTGMGRTVARTGRLGQGVTRWLDWRKGTEAQGANRAGEDARAGFFSGYLKDEEATEAAWQDGWLHTGDLVFADDDGLMYFFDRKKTIVRRSGENIGVLEVARERRVEAVHGFHPLLLAVFDLIELGFHAGASVT